MLDSNIGLNDPAEEIYKFIQKKGIDTPKSLQTQEERDKIIGKLMLVITEISEATEAIRNNDFDNFKKEMADTFIRLLDICGAMSIDIELEIYKKMKINEHRPERNEKQCSL